MSIPKKYQGRLSLPRRSRKAPFINYIREESLYSKERRNSHLFRRVMLLFYTKYCSLAVGFLTDFYLAPFTGCGSHMITLLPSKFALCVILVPEVDLSLLLLNYTWVCFLCMWCVPILGFYLVCMLYS